MRRIWASTCLALLCGACDSSTTANATYTVAGKVEGNGQQKTTRGRAATTAHVTHVMAVDPQAANPARFVTKVEASGAFALQVPPKSPYVLVFIDSTQRGTDMIVGIFKSQTLDTLAPVTDTGKADLGRVTLDANTKVAASDTPYATLLGQLGLDPNAALTLGAVDDISLRLANPDIDGDGQIDALANQQFWVDFHVRTENIRLGSAQAPEATVHDIVEHFLDATGSRAAHAVFNLASIYAVYPSSFDNHVYAGAGLTLQGGGSFGATLTGDLSVAGPSSFSQGSFGDYQQWGPDYQLSQVQMPGSAGAPATLTFGLAGGKQLTFPNVVTRTKAQLEASGTIIPFLSLHTSDGTDSGTLTSFDYKFMKRVTGGAWEAASDQEVELIVGESGAFASFYLGSKSSPASFKIPRQAHGSISWVGGHLRGANGASETQVAAATPASICSMAISYDDKLGLRIFAGNVAPLAGVAPCN